MSVLTAVDQVPAGLCKDGNTGRMLSWVLPPGELKRALVEHFQHRRDCIVERHRQNQVDAAPGNNDVGTELPRVDGVLREYVVQSKYHNSSCSGAQHSCQIVQCTVGAIDCCRCKGVAGVECPRGAVYQAVGLVAVVIEVAPPQVGTCAHGDRVCVPNALCGSHRERVRKEYQKLAACLAASPRPVPQAETSGLEARYLPQFRGASPPSMPSTQDHVAALVRCLLREASVQDELGSESELSLPALYRVESVFHERYCEQVYHADSHRDLRTRGICQV